MTRFSAMKSSTLYAFKKWCTVLGSCLVVLPAGFIWYWGNMSVYIISYVLKHLPDSSNVDSPWVVSLAVLGNCIGNLTSSVTTRFLGKRFTIILGITIFSGGWLGAYFAIKKSFTVVNLVIGLVTAFGAYMLEGPALQYVFEWCQDDLGKMTGIVLSGQTVGEIFFNQFITIYVNPHNLLPDKKVGRSKYFSQNEVVEAVPSMILMIALISLVLTIIGLLVMRENHVERLDKEHYDLSYGTNGDVLDSKQSDADVSPDGLTLESTHDLSPTQLFRTPSLYQFWFLFVMSEVPFLILCNYYKSFGQLYIKDDHYLTNLSTALLVSITLSRVFWGFTLDRHGLKTSLIALFSCSPITILCLYFSPLFGKWSYAVMTIVFGFFGSPTYVFFAYAAVWAFGKRHFIFNFGIIMLPSVLINLALPPLLECLLEKFGWFYVFGFSSCCSLAGLVFVMFLLPHKEVMLTS